MRYASRVDENQAEIVRDLRAAGVSVTLLHPVGHGCPDLLCGFRGMNYLLEVKSDGGRLTPAQHAWHDTWRGQAAVVRNSEEAYKVLKVGSLLDADAQQRLVGKDPLTVGLLTLHPATGTVTTAEGQYHLTPVQTCLLRHLMLESPNPLLSSTILKEVWGYTLGLGTSALVRAHVWNIRRTIEPDPTHPRYLLTMPRRGYYVPERAGMVAPQQEP